MGPTLTVLWNNETNCLNFLLPYLIQCCLIRNLAMTSYVFQGFPLMERDFVSWKKQLELLIWAHGLYEHLDGTTTKPDEPLTRPEGTTLIADEVSEIERQQIALTIPNSLYLKIKGRMTERSMGHAQGWLWEEILHDHDWAMKKAAGYSMCQEWKHMYPFQHHTNNARRACKLRNKSWWARFFSYNLGSLPKSYDQFILAVTATASVLKQELNPKDLMQTIIGEYDCWSTRYGTKEKNANAAFFAGSNNQGGKKKSDEDIECFNCCKKSHKKADCWAKGGGKEGLLENA